MLAATSSVSGVSWCITSEGKVPFHKFSAEFFDQLRVLPCLQCLPLRCQADFPGHMFTTTPAGNGCPCVVVGQHVLTTNHTKYSTTNSFYKAPAGALLLTPVPLDVFSVRFLRPDWARQMFSRCCRPCRAILLPRGLSLEAGVATTASESCSLTDFIFSIFL